MEIPVKYSVGSSVYIVHNVNSIYYPENTEYIIKSINILVSDADTKIMYTLSAGTQITTVAESYIFTTYKEAKDWTNFINNYIM